MANRDWNDLGDEIKNLVQDAIDSKDYSKLSQTIGRSLDGAFNGVADGIKNAGDAVNRAAGEINENMMNGRYRYRPGGNSRPFSEQSINQKVERQELRGPYAQTGGMRAGGFALAITGYILAGGLGITELVFGCVALFASSLPGASREGLAIASAIIAPMLGGSIWMGLAGSSMLLRVRRFKTYVRELGGQTFCRISDLAAAVKKSKGYVVNDLRKMIDKGMFIEGHIDKQNTCLMVTDDIYNQYQIADQQFQQRELKHKKESIQEKPQEKVPEGKLPPEVQKIIDEGNAYLGRIRRCNEDIPGEEISLKISRIEVLVQKIFQRVEQDHSILADLRKMMEYYLPTTIKLIEAYRDLDAQPIQGATISSSKKEIEETLDTINMAFEKLLDSFFKDTAWDVSTDISVLQTMLAQEGLTKNDF